MNLFEINKAISDVIEKGFYEDEETGEILFEIDDLDDLKITLLTGRDHKKHTSGGDFRQATYRAIRQGIEQSEN